MKGDAEKILLGMDLQSIIEESKSNGKIDYNKIKLDIEKAFSKAGIKKRNNIVSRLQVSTKILKSLPVKYISASKDLNMLTNSDKGTKLLLVPDYPDDIEVLAGESFTDSCHRFVVKDFV